MNAEINADLLDVCLGMADLIDRCGLQVNKDFDDALRAAIAKAEDQTTSQAPNATAADLLHALKLISAIKPMGTAGTEDLWLSLGEVRRIALPAIAKAEEAK